MKSNLLIPALMALCVGTIATFIGCTKNTNPQPPIHDTVTVIKKDTTTDTLYATKPDSTLNLTKGLLVYLPFSGNIADSSGNNNPTAAIGNVLTYDEHGWANNAFGSSGTNEVLVTNNGSIKFDTAWSLAIAFMVNGNTQAATFVSMIDPQTGYAPTFNFGQTLASAPYYIACGSGDITQQCNTFAVVNNYNITDTTSFLPNPGSWYKAVVIYHRGTLQTYINGVLISTKVGQGTEAALCPNSKIIIGNWWNGGSQGINGKLDNFRLYNRVLTAHEVAALSTNYLVTSNSVKRTPVTVH